MTTRTELTLRVELHSQGDSIGGRVLNGGDAGWSFSGWVGLAAAIEAAIEAEGELCALAFDAPSGPAKTDGAVGDSLDCAGGEITGDNPNYEPVN